MLKEVYLQRLQLLTLLQPYHGGLEVPRKLLQNFRFDFSPLATRTIFTLEMLNYFRNYGTRKPFGQMVSIYKGCKCVMQFMMLFQISRENKQN